MEEKIMNNEVLEETVVEETGLSEIENDDISYVRSEKTNLMNPATAVVLGLAVYGTVQGIMAAGRLAKKGKDKICKFIKKKDMADVEEVSDEEFNKVSPKDEEESKESK